jgi:hypothetical protein
MASAYSPNGEEERQAQLIEAFAGLDRITQALDGMRITNPRRVYLTVLRDELERELEGIWRESSSPNPGDAMGHDWDETTAQMWKRACSIWAIG